MTHPPDDFHVYRGRLAALLPVLSIEAQQKPEGQWAYRVLPNGALVAVKYEGTRRVVRLAREEAPANFDGWKKWQKECETFVKHLGLGMWSPIPPRPAGEGRPEA